MLKQFIFLFFSIIIHLNSFGKFDFNEETVSVNLFSSIKINELLIAPQKGNYTLIADGNKLLELDETSIIKASLINDKIEIKAFENNLGTFKNISFVSESDEKYFKIKLLNPDRKPRFYDDNLTISIDEKLGLKLINTTEIDNYIAGVSEAEAGKSAGIEFYKVQSVLARTYALAHLYKHLPEGFNLCDQVHCQAFNGKSINKNIVDAVIETKGQVVVDKDLQLITAAFHSNSGGQTANSEDVWGATTSYLKSVIDTFSLKMPNAYWKKNMAKEEWLNYLKTKHKFPIQSDSAVSSVLSFKNNSRKVYLEFENIKIPFKTLRTDLKLKSAFFDIEYDKENNTVVFKGKGFGHGIGMSQEGAIYMTKSGYSYKDVLNFYYQNIHIIDLKELHFFKE